MKLSLAPGLAGACLVSIFLHGCSGGPDRPEAYPVTGVVTLDGKPVDKANVLFVPEDKSLQPASAVTDAEGKYALTTFSQGDGALPGTYKIKVLKYNGPSSQPAGGEEQRYISYEEEQKAYVENSKAPPRPKNLLPRKYEFEARSGLTHTVSTGPSTFDIKLES